MTTVIAPPATRLLRAVPDLPAPDDVMAEIEDADALHETACDNYDNATRDLENARQALTEAARRLTEAEVAWSTAGSQMNAVARHLFSLREAAGVVVTADGYRPVTR
jgi:cystathionine beta-lyase/cystathionine gamma-synthase